MYILYHVYIYISYTWIVQVCKICAFSPKKTYQKAEILHIWKIQVYIMISHIIQTYPNSSHTNP